MNRKYISHAVFYLPASPVAGNNQACSVLGHQGAHAACTVSPPGREAEPRQTPMCPGCPHPCTSGPLSSSPVTFGVRDVGSQGFSGVRATSFPHLLAKDLSGSYGMLGTQQELHQSPCPQGVDILPGAPTNGPQIGVSMVPPMRGEQSDVGGTTKGHMGDAMTGQRKLPLARLPEPDVSNCYMAIKMWF